MTELHRCRFLRANPPTIVRLNKSVAVTKYAVHILEDSIIINTIHGEFINAFLENDFLFLLNVETIGKLNLKNGQLDVAHSIYRFVDFQLFNETIAVIDGNTVQLIDFDLEIQKTYHHSSSINEFYCTSDNLIVTAHDSYIQVRKNGELQYSMECETPWCVSTFNQFVLSGHSNGISIWNKNILVQHLETKLDILTIKGLYAIGLQGTLYELQVINEKWSIKKQQHIHTHEARALHVDNFVYSAGLDGIIHKRNLNFDLVDSIPLNLLIKSQNKRIAYANETKLQIVTLNGTPTPEFTFEDVVVNFELYEEMVVVQTLEHVKVVSDNRVTMEYLGCKFMCVVIDELYLFRSLNQVEIINLQSGESQLIHLNLSTPIEQLFVFQDYIVLKCWNMIHLLKNQKILYSYDFLLPVRDIAIMNDTLIVLADSLHVYNNGSRKTYKIDNYLKMTTSGDALYLYNRDKICKVEQDICVKRKLDNAKLKTSAPLKQYKDLERFEMWDAEHGYVVERPLSLRIKDLPARLIGPWR
eukprot:NODE_301_length_11418_cov_0.342521.p1 type:complete len:527 gc:universal NODE_301_length_11418_cov_0.342521:6875-8455(+)